HPKGCRGRRRDARARRALLVLDRPLRGPGRGLGPGRRQATRWARRPTPGDGGGAVTTEAQVRVVFTPSGKRGAFAAGTSVLEAARTLAVDLDSVCGGRGICGRCQIVVSEGAHAKHAIDSAAGHLTPFSAPEALYRDRRGLSADRRLGCHARMIGDLVIDVPPDSQLHRQVVRKEADARQIELDPVVRLPHVAIEPPVLA